MKVGHVCTECGEPWKVGTGLMCRTCHHRFCDGRCFVEWHERLFRRLGQTGRPMTHTGMPAEWRDEG